MVNNNFFWIGGALWLDFINTEKMASGQRVDLLAETTAILGWLEASGSVPEAVCQRALQWDESELENLRESAHTLRGALRSLCEDFSAKGSASPLFVATINEFLLPPAPGLRLKIREEGNCDLVEEWGHITPRQLLFPVARAAAETLSRGDLGRLRRCANPNCILWFLDSSKNGQRRWCSMDTCGNRHKVSQHQLRKKVDVG